jgi:tRNA G18 (ribose-2'-O)-methylase SpoU
MADEDQRKARAARVKERMEFVLAHRTDRIMLVLEGCSDNANYLACMRSADILGATRSFESKRVGPGFSL